MHPRPQPTRPGCPRPRSPSRATRPGPVHGLVSPAQRHTIDSAAKAPAPQRHTRQSRGRRRGRRSRPIPARRCRERRFVPRRRAPTATGVARALGSDRGLPSRRNGRNCAPRRPQPRWPQWCPRRAARVGRAQCALGVPARCHLGRIGRVDLDLDGPPQLRVVCTGVEYLGQGGDVLAGCRPLQRVCRERAASEVDRPKLCEGQVGHPRIRIVRPGHEALLGLHGGVVPHDDLPVGGEAHVQLDARRPGVDGGAHARDGVLRGQRTSAPVTLHAMRAEIGTPRHTVAVTTRGSWAVRVAGSGAHARNDSPDSVWKKWVRSTSGRTWTTSPRAILVRSSSLTVMRSFSSPATGWP